MKKIFIILSVFIYSLCSAQVGRINNSGFKAGDYFNLSCVVNGGVGAFTPSDATTYYFGPLLTGFPANTTDAYYASVMPVDCTLIGYSITNKQNTAATTTETSSFYFRYGSTDVTLNTGIIFLTTSAVTHTYAMNLSTNVNAGTGWQVKWVTPTWTTNPAQAQVFVTLYFVTR